MFELASNTFMLNLLFFDFESSPNFSEESRVLNNFLKLFLVLTQLYM